jgi:alkylation response protein AidB-like acyl-CoA dehydrogenase
MTTADAEEARSIKALVHAFAEERVKPRAAEIDASGEFPWDLVEAMRELDLFALPFATTHGGTGTGNRVFLDAIAEVARVCATTALTLALQETGSLAIKLSGNAEQQERYLPRLASGEWLCAYALTEPEAGSDAASLRTVARRESGGYVLNGTKCFISNAGVASVYTVFVSTDTKARHRGVTAFAVEAQTAGLSVLRIEQKMGLKAHPTGELQFTDCFVPEENRLGDEGSGFTTAMRVLDRSRPGIAAQPTGIAEGATAYALDYARTRQTFGQPIVKHQLVAALLADMQTRCVAARGLVERVGRLLDDGVAGPPLTEAAAIAKLFASDIAVAVATDAIQVLGGYGYLRDYPLERMLRDAKATQIYEGTNQIQRLVIAREMARSVAQ